MGHHEAALHIVTPSRMAEGVPGHRPLCKGEREGRPEKEVAHRGVTVGQVNDRLRQPKHLGPLTACREGANLREGQSHRENGIVDGLDEDDCLGGQP